LGAQRFGPIRNRGTSLLRIRRLRRETTETAQALTQAERTKKAMAETENAKSKILGLLETRKHRGLSGQAAINEWIVSAIEVLLEHELAKIEKKEVDAT